MCVYEWRLTSCLLALGVVDLNRQRPVLKLSYQVDECVVQSLLRREQKYICGSASINRDHKAKAQRMSSLLDNSSLPIKIYGQSGMHTTLTLNGVPLAPTIKSKNDTSPADAAGESA